MPPDDASHHYLTYLGTLIPNSRAVVSGIGGTAEWVQMGFFLCLPTGDVQNLMIGR